MSLDVDRIDPLPLAELQRRYLNRGIPVIIRGIVSEWPAASMWTPEYLADKVGHKLLPVKRIRDGDYTNPIVDEMSVREYLQHIGALPGSANAPRLAPGCQLYLSEVPMEKYVPELLEDVHVPSFFPGESPKASVIYVGNGLFSQLHYHPFGSATLCLLYGSKRVRLFAPDQTRYLYKYPVYSTFRNMSRTTAKTPDPAAFPDFANAEYVEFDVNAGEMLFIPIYYWHSIENLELNIASVFFWERSLKSRFLPPPGLRSDYAHSVAVTVPYLLRRIIRRVGHVASLRAK